MGVVWCDRRRERIATPAKQRKQVIKQISIKSTKNSITDEKFH